ncbi:hypothetical protein TDB9533_00781 [Thalassocella blandensis]|nr:hypothetical protein TDB9533_00781 [Thalassocella blandensis]
MGELLAALAGVLGVYLLYFVGRFAIFFCTVGLYKAEPLEPISGKKIEGVPPQKTISKKATMIIGFVVLVLLIILIALYFSPENAF